MAVTSSKPTKQTGRWSLQGAEYTATYSVTAEFGDDPFTVLSGFAYGASENNPGVPYFGTVLSEFTCEQTDILEWTVTKTSRTLTAEEKEKAEKTPPVDRSVVISYRTNEFEELAEADIDGHAINNSANDPVNPAANKRNGKGQLVIKKNYAGFDASQVANYIFHVNGSSLFGYPANTLLCTSISADPESTTIDDIEYYYYSVTLEFEIDTEYQHTLRIQDRGMNQIIDDPKNPGEKIKVAIVDDQKAVVSDPVCLDGDGKKMAIDGTPEMLEFDIYEQANFGALGL